MIETYAEYGAIGVIVSLFIMLIMNLMKSQKMQEDVYGKFGLLIQQNHFPGGRPIHCFHRNKVNTC